jgi:hypothetical protein
MSGQPTGPKVIVFQFIGGGRDSQTVCSDRPKQVNEANAFWALTWNGTVGRRFDVSVPNEPASQRYQVVSRYETSGEIHVDCEYVGGS